MRGARRGCGERGEGWTAGNSGQCLGEEPPRPAPASRPRVSSPPGPGAPPLPLRDSRHPACCSAAPAREPVRPTAPQVSARSQESRRQAWGRGASAGHGLAGPASVPAAPAWPGAPSAVARDSLSQLPAPRNPKVHLYNAERVLSWEPVSLSNDSRPVVYQVQYKYASGSQWYDFSVDSIGVNCMNITTMECDFTPTSPSQEFLPHLNVSLRVRAKVGDLVSTWVRVPWFQYLRNVTVGPPENVWVTPGEGSLVIRFSSPFDISPSSATFLYYVHYWEKGGIQKVKGPFRSNSIVLNDLKPLREYCLQVKAQLVWTVSKLSRLGHLSNVSCYETAADATTKLQQIIIIAVGIFLLLLALAGACFFLVLKYKGLIKYWFHSPPTIPLQIEEYLKDPSQPILEALDKDSSPKDDAWDSVSIVSFPEKEREDVLQSTLN
ncbi:interferon gamma receptor 2 isoform X1 [Canis aureus]|eukprot:XP_005638898.1 interferon gamma receptor 2 isoform X1 [Canis lupus familiaris]